MLLYNKGVAFFILRKLGLAVFMLLILSSYSLLSQENRNKRANRRSMQHFEIQVPNSSEKSQIDSLNINLDSLKAVQDSLAFIKDSTAKADSIHRSDSVDMLNKSSLDAPAFSTARDSIIEDFSNGKQVIYYYGDVTVKYGNMELTADYMEYDLKTSTVFARGTADTSGVIVGRPVMKQGEKSYEMDEVRYNFNTMKARITNMVTQEQDGILHGKKIKMMPDKSINIADGRYTVCDCEEPHYYLHLSRAKVITKPSQQTVFGPAWPVIAGVPLPIALPFGFIPERPDRATGILFPSFGEEAARGFYMRDAGLYFVLGDYFDISLTTDIYTMGSWAVDVNSRYKVNYKCNGGFGITYSNDQTGEEGSTDFFQTKNFSVKWSHSQDPKARPGTSFSASVNFSTPSNSKYNSTSINDALQNQINSSISYSKNWNGKINLSVNALHSQNSRDSSYNFTLPDITFSVSRFYPFKQKNRIGKEKFYEKFSFGYNTSFKNKINFKASEFNTPGFWDKFQTGMAHNFQIGLPNFTLLKYINVTPGIQYGMNWFFRKTEKEYNPETDKVEEVKGPTFGTFGATHTYSGSISMSTRLYGMFNFGKHRALQAIRHVVTPTISASFSPEKGTYFNGWRTLTYTDASGKEQSQDYNIYAGQLNSVPGKGKTASLNFSLGNNLEAKVRDLADTTGKGTKKIKLIDQLTLDTGYNFLAEEFNLSNIGLTMSTSVFGKLNITANANLDPYGMLVNEENKSGKRVNQFAVTMGQGLARLTNATVSLQYSIAGEGKGMGYTGTEQTASANPADHYTRIFYHPVTGEYIPGGWLYYMNPNVPWSVSFNYSYNFSRGYQWANGKETPNNRHTQTLGINASVKLTPRMSVQLQTGFDLMAVKMTTTQLSASYDLHCFNIRFNWVPSGQWESWTFQISANAAALADLLKYKKSSSYWDNGF